MRSFRISLAALALLVAACSDEKPIDFKIVAGSENTVVEPIVQEFCRGHGMSCSFEYKGSLDIGAALAPNATLDADAVWPAASLWIDLFDTGRKVKNLKSVSQSPVILGVRMAKAKELGWTDHAVTTRDIVAAVKAGKLKFLMTSATQSNSGASAYLAMLSVLVGAPDVIAPEDLNDPTLQEDIKALLSGVERSSGSSGWLKDLFLAGRSDGSEYDAMWNYEGVIKEANDALQQAGKEKLWAVYPADGVFVADSPLGFVDRGRGPDVEKRFTELQDFMQAPEQQKKIAALGRRVALSDAAAKPEPDWNFNPAQMVTSVRTPAPDVIRSALALYQESLRRPSLTAFCLDYSGSMQGEGERQLGEAMRFLLSPAETSQALIQWTPKDKIRIFTFNNFVNGDKEGDGTPQSQADLLNFVERQHADGGTNMYVCLNEAMHWIEAQPDRGNYLPAILVMTDGKSDGSPNQFEAGSGVEGNGVPVFGVTFGDADASQLDKVANMTRARVFDGRKDLQSAFRAARGYN
jgi:Ca-activated chloride channel family protein